MIDHILELIFNYITKDKTQNALMLTAPWGTGKSYFINNNLLNFLKDKGIKCIVVSLYGLNSLQELSRTIFFESKCKIINQKSFAVESAKIVATTIAKGVASFWGVNLNVSERQLQRLYKSLDFSKTLLVLEDFERSDIEIKEVLGFVNNLVEHDGAKVLLVANENELLKKETKLSSNEQSKVLDKSGEYLSMKEKTIGDTIHFEYVDEKVLESIMFEFNSALFNQLTKKYPDICSTILKEIMNFKEISCSNLRAFKFACQKTIDLFGDNFAKFDNDFLYDIFMGNVAFCLRKSKGGKIYWNDEESTSIFLGTASYPLFKISYLYIQENFISKELLDNQYSNYKTIKDNNYKNEQITNILNVIYKYYYSSEEELTLSLNKIEKEIVNNNLSVNEYLKLANYLISIKENIPFYSEIVDKLKEKLLNSISHRNDLPSSIMLLGGIELESKDAKEEYKVFSKLLNECLLKEKVFLNFDYTSKSLPQFAKNVFKKESLISGGSFLSNLNLDKFVSFLKECSAQEIDLIRKIFNHVYNYLNINESYYLDYIYLLNLKEKLEEILKYENQDKIIHLQYKWFVDDLNFITRFLKKEEKYYVK